MAGIACAQSGSWLDRPPVQWNQPGRSVPAAPQAIDWTDVPDICQSLRERKDINAEEKAVSRRGWFVIGSSGFGHGVVIIVGAADLDGMCRPNQYQDFVFLNGKFAGTLSPLGMNSRADGASGRITLLPSGKIRVEFLRYSDRDPRCCASRISEATFEIGKKNGRNVIVLEGVQTSPAG
jgi:hypothetical protein